MPELPRDSLEHELHERELVRRLDRSRFSRGEQVADDIECKATILVSECGLLLWRQIEEDDPAVNDLLEHSLQIDILPLRSFADFVRT